MSFLQDNVALAIPPKAKCQNILECRMSFFLLRQPISDNTTIRASFNIDKQNEIRLKKMLNMMHACVKLLLMLCKLSLHIETKL